MCPLGLCSTKKPGWDRVFGGYTCARHVYRPIIYCLKVIKVARDSCDVTHSLKQASIHTSHVHASKSCTKYSLHLVQSASTH